MMKFLSAVISDVRNGENIDVYLSVPICLGVVILDLFGVVQSQIVTAAILLTLALLSFSTVATRKTMRDLNDSLDKLEGERGAEAFFRDRNAFAPIPETLATAQHICLLGPSLINLFQQWGEYLHLVKLDKHGATIQVLLVDPDCPAADSAAKCVNEPLDNFRREIQRSLSLVERMLQDGLRAGSIEVRLMPTNPNYSIVLVDPDKPQGRMLVEFIGYRSPLHNRPHIELTQQRDEWWYKHFLDQCNLLWKTSQVRLTSRQQS